MANNLQHCRSWIWLDNVEYKQVDFAPAYFISRRGDMLSTRNLGGYDESHIRYLHPIKGHFDKGTKRYIVAFYSGKGIKPHIVGVHVAVLSVWGRPKQKGEVARHLDGNALNNDIENLAWGTIQDNIEDQRKHGHFVKGVKHGCHIFTEEDVREIRRLYKDTPLTMKALSHQYQCAFNSIRQIIRGITWTHIV